MDVFAVLDSDGNGVVSYKEFFSVLEENSANLELYKKEDKNTDGVISWQEFGGTCPDVGRRSDVAIAANYRLSTIDTCCLGPKSATPPTPATSTAAATGGSEIDENNDPALAEVFERQEKATAASYSRECVDDVSESSV